MIERMALKMEAMHSRIAQPQRHVFELGTPPGKVSSPFLFDFVFPRLNVLRRYLAPTITYNWSTFTQSASCLSWKQQPVVSAAGLAM